MADSSLNEPPVKKPRVDSPPKDSTVIEINDEVDNTTKNDSTVIEINDEVDNTTKNDSTVIEINDEVDNTTKNDTDPKSGSSNQLDDSDPKGENDKSIPIIDLLSDSEMDSDKPLDVDCSEVAKIQPAAGDKKNDGKNDAKKPEDVFDDNDVGSSDEEDEGVKSKKEVPLEAFNMEEEKEMGSFDEDFNFQWKTKSREPTDAWLASEGSTPLDREIEPPVPESSSGSNGEEKTESNKPTIEELKNHLSFVQYYMKGDETVRVAVSRMSNPLAASASARLALKKAGGSYKVAPTSQEATSLHTFLGKVTSFPVKADIYNLKQSEIQSIIADHDKLFAFREQAYGSNPIEITSDDDSDEEVEEVPSKKDKKRSIMMYVSSSDDDDVEEVKDQGKPAGANGGGLDMFAQ